MTSSGPSSRRLYNKRVFKNSRNLEEVGPSTDFTLETYSRAFCMSMMGGGGADVDANVGGEDGEGLAAVECCSTAANSDSAASGFFCVLLSLTAFPAAVSVSHGGFPRSSLSLSLVVTCMPSLIAGGAAAAEDDNPSMLLLLLLSFYRDGVE